MATPVGHLLAGGLVGVTLSAEGDTRRGMAAGALAAIAADLDFVPGAFLGDPARFHHAQSHSFAFALFVALAVVLTLRGSRVRWAVLAGLAYASHLLLDYFTYDNSAPQGIPLFWPLSDSVMQSGTPLLPNVLHASGSMVSLHNVKIIATELLILGPLLALAFYMRQRRSAAKHSPF